MTAKEVLVSLIKRFEGIRLKAYLCPAGVWTIGWGSTGKGIVKGLTWTKQQADERMLKDADTYLLATKNLCPKIAGEIHGSIADFTYNLGATRLAGSTLRRKLNKGDFNGAATELQKWVWAGGKKLPGLVARRKAEAQLILNQLVQEVVQTRPS